MRPIVHHGGEHTTILHGEIHTTTAVEAMAELLTNDSYSGCIHQRSDFIDLYATNSRYQLIIHEKARIKAQKKDILT